jgi:hypothetical protein
VFFSFASLQLDDETLPIINKPKHPKKENIRNKMEGPTSKETKESPKKGNIKFLTPITRNISNRERGGLLKGCLA